ncbi:ankyrin repeat and SAM domain-containing protein 1A-like [Thalassophryne amazonica]|uniref:ankyrin repeat and SAM domain-containing protein 1A-like n=1 Tax=Thalassophryne amazonica TaxID=390379 RepID=UPI001472619E|nr:ankyrin repeat and SAM domain-containing protein 1A-like [Thalassophryne amazonica]
MAECTLGDNTAKVIQIPQAHIKKSNQASDEPALMVVKARPVDLGLIRSLSKSDSDLLASPSGEEEGGRAGCGGSVSTERFPSFSSEWDEIEKMMNLIGAGIETSGSEQAAPSSDGACGKALDQPVGEWLEHVGLPQYESKFLLNGFDDLRFMIEKMMNLIGAGIETSGSEQGRTELR